MSPPATPAALTDVVAGHGDRAPALALDVTDKDRVAEVVKKAESAFGLIDVLVNNAGYGYLAALEEGEDEEVRALFDTNVFTRAVLPGMRARRAYHVVNISSLGGLAAFGATGYHHATKFAVEGLSESLAAEVAPLGIKVTIVGPPPSAPTGPAPPRGSPPSPSTTTPRARAHGAPAPSPPTVTSQGTRPGRARPSSARWRRRSPRCGCCWARPPTTSSGQAGLPQDRLRRLARCHPRS